MLMQQTHSDNTNMLMLQLRLYVISFEGIWLLTKLLDLLMVEDRLS